MPSSRSVLPFLAAVVGLSSGGSTILPWRALPYAHVQQSEVEVLRDTERRRLRALIDGDTATAMLLHAPDFQLVTPGGTTMTREQYLGGLASGLLRYATWEPESISIRLHGTAAVLRYRSRLVMVISGRDTVKPFPHWHTDFYEKRDGRWQAVWSQATPIRTAARIPLLQSARVGGADSVIARYGQLKQGRESAVWAFDENQLITVSRLLFEEKKNADAVRVLQLNVAEYPSASSPQAVLGEAYLKVGDTTRAIIAYECAVQLDPRNASAAEALRRLRGR